MPIGGASSGRVCACSLRSRLVFTELTPIQSLSHSVSKSSVFVYVPLWKTCFPVDRTLLVKGCITKIDIWVFAYCVLGDLAVEESVAVAVGVIDG